MSEAFTSIALEFPSGGAASFVLNRVSAGEERYCDIVLTGVDSEARCSIGGRADLEFGIAARSRLPYARARFAMGGTAERIQAGRSQLLAREGSNPFAAATAVRLRAFHDQIVRDVPMARSAAYHREMLALALAAYESAETGPADRHGHALRADFGLLPLARFDPHVRCGNALQIVDVQDTSDDINGISGAALVAVTRGRRTPEQTEALARGPVGDFARLGDVARARLLLSLHGD